MQRRRVFTLLASAAIVLQRRVSLHFRDFKPSSPSYCLITP
jgi:hypothetical protein